MKAWLIGMCVGAGLLALACGQEFHPHDSGVAAMSTGPVPCQGPNLPGGKEEEDPTRRSGGTDGGTADSGTDNSGTDNSSTADGGTADGGHARDDGCYGN